MKKFIVLLSVLFVVITLALLSGSAMAVQFTGVQVSPTEWNYTLTFDPLDNYSIFPVATQSTNITTITITGLFGVSNAVGPSSTDFPNFDLNNINLDWTAQVLNGGTEVQWTHIGPGTGNFTNPLHVFGFEIIANNAVDGSASLFTSGFSRDTNNPLPDGSFNLDISGTVNGPVAAQVPEPGTLFMLGSGLWGFAALRKKFKN